MKSRRPDGRRANELRPVTITRGYTQGPPGSVMIRQGGTMVLCTACVEESVPEWRKASGLGWVTAEYDMLPGSTGRRRPRQRIRPDGRSTEIQRLIGRVLRSVVDSARLGPRSIWIDCDVIQADGGTRSAAITGAFVAAIDAVRWLLARNLICESPLIEPVAAISVGRIDGQILLDLDYAEDSRAEVDFNVAMTASGKLVEVQASAEGGTFSRADLDRMLALAAGGIRKLVATQRKALAGKK
ncbi:MAG TPA: ribonuclease PH [Phycisphaerae bacterium]|nr:ribonuclease PH [Phycisphaerae bacterium]